MYGVGLLLTVFLFTSTISFDHYSTISDRNHHRQRRFVFFPGSVLQLAAGLAIPAGVKNKIIYTNYGIMINYDLPTNLSSLLPITIVEEVRGVKSWDQLSTDLFKRFGWNSGCWQKLERWVDKNKQFKGGLMHELARMLLRERENNQLLRSDVPQEVISPHDICSLLDEQILK